MDKMKVSRLGLVFIISFFLSLIWENVHSRFYLYYQGVPINEAILMRAALVDALIILLLSAVFRSFSALSARLWILFAVGFLIAIGIKWWALQTGRWTYNKQMPLLPGIHTGLTPTIQLGILSFVAYHIVYATRR